MDIPDSYAETMDILQSPLSSNIPELIATVSTRLLSEGNGRAAAVIDGLAFHLKRIARLLETNGGHSEAMPEEAYRIAMQLTTE